MYETISSVNSITLVYLACQSVFGERFPWTGIAAIALGAFVFLLTLTARPLLSLDWSVGMIYLPSPPVEIELTRSAALQAELVGNAPFYKKLEDALSVPRLKSLLQALRYVVRAPDRLAAFRGVFLQSGGEEYRCPDGTVAGDFDVVRRGYCVGYRYDGSWTFGDQKYLTPAHVAVLAQAAAAPSSKYAEWLLKSGGIPNPVYLQRSAGRC